MRDPEHEAQQKEAQKPEEAVISGWTLTHYFHLVRMPVFVVVVAEMVLFILTALNPLVWLLHIALFLYLLFTVKDLTVQRAASLGAVAGFFAGLGIAIFRLVYERAAYFIFNLIAEPVITAICGALIAAVVLQTIKTRAEKRKKNLSKTSSSEGGQKS